MATETEVPIIAEQAASPHPLLPLEVCERPDVLVTMLEAMDRYWISIGDGLPF